MMYFTRRFTHFYKCCFSVIVGSILFLSTNAHGGAILFVDDDAFPGGDGASWDTAYLFLQDALAAASGGGISEIHIAQGTYKPDRDEANPGGTGDREATYQLLNGVAFMGGYAGIGAKDPNARDIELFETILSGDLWNNDLPICDNSHPSLAENLLHVLVAEKVNGTAILDGVTIKSGHAFREGNWPAELGGGVLVMMSTPTIRNCTFLNNRGSDGGAIAIFEPPAEILIQDCTFIENGSSVGGAIFHINGPLLDIVDCLFEANCTTSGDGGAIMVTGGASLNVAGCSFVDNATDGGNRGGGLYVVGGSLQAVQCSFIGNYAANGAGIYLQSGGSVEISDCVFEDNQGTAVTVDNSEGIMIVDSHFARNDGGGFWDQGFNGDPIVINCQFVDHPNFGVNVTHDSTFVNCLFSGNNTPTFGGGAIIGQSSLLVNCTFENNTAFGSGGGLEIWGGYIISCVFDNNSGFRGGAIEAGVVQIYDCQFNQNSADTGGAIDFDENPSGPASQVVNSTFAGNTADFGGAIYVNNASAKVANCTIVGNGATGLGGGLYSFDPGTLNIYNSIVWDNIDGSGSGEDSQIFGITSGATFVDYSCVQGWSGTHGGKGNTGENPLLIDPDGIDDIYGTIDDNPRLLSGSPCIDSGNNWAMPIDARDYDEDGILCELFPVDLDGNPRFNADEVDFDTGCGIPVVVDMGAYEYQFDPVDQITFADLTGDNAVNTIDLLDLFANWGDCAEGCCLSDLDLDGTVNTNDLLILFSNWGVCN